MAERERVVVKSPSGGWPPPWSSVAELAAALSSEHWTLIGGLMTQLQALHHGVDAVRPTNDIDILVHVETGTGKPARVAAALTTLGYVLQPSIDRRRRTAHRFVRGRQTVDLVASPPSDVVDVLVADHAPPRVRESLGGHQMVEVEGGTQALRRTMIMVATIAGDSETALVISRTRLHSWPVSIHLRRGRRRVGTGLGSSISSDALALLTSGGPERPGS